MMKQAIEVLFDDRFGWRFKLANLIMGDYLRNYLAVGVLTPLRDVIENDYLDRHYGDNFLINDMRNDCKKAYDTVKELMEM